MLGQQSSLPTQTVARQLDHQHAMQNLSIQGLLSVEFESFLMKAGSKVVEVPQ